MRTHLAAVALLVVLATGGLTACTSQAQAPPASTPTPVVQTITVTLTDTAVIASQSTLRPGVRCRFIVTNRGTRPHQFWLMPQGLTRMMSEMPMAQWRQQVLYSSQDIGPGMMATFDYTFTMPMMQQQWAFGCYTANGQSVIMMPIRLSP